MNSMEQLAAFNTAEISDALDACGCEGALLNLHALVPGVRIIGPAYTIKYAPYSAKPTGFQGAADYIDAIPARHVVVIDNGGRIDCTTWGSILTHTALKKDLAGTVVHGAIRDAAFIRASNYPVFCSAVYMRSGKNRVYKDGEQCRVIINGVPVTPGDIIFADENGVVVIPVSRLQEVLHKAQAIQDNEKKIIAAIDAGASLRQARKDYRYDMPWFNKSDN